MVHGVHIFLTFLWLKSESEKYKSKSEKQKPNRDWLVFCTKSPELKIVPVADTTAAWAFDVEVAAKQNDDKYVPYIKALLHKRGLILKSKDYSDNNKMVICLITRLT